MDTDTHIIDLLEYDLGRISWVISNDVEARAASGFVTGLESPQFL
jgi:hypothetical protein